MPAAIDVAIPRECIYRRFEGQPGPCPRCGGTLQSQYAHYMVTTWRGKRAADSFFIGNDMGWFCARCPTVVINPAEVIEYFSHSLPKWNVGDEFAVAGILDLDAIPEEKRNLPLGRDGNPIPLVKFTGISDEMPLPPSETSAHERVAPAQDGRRLEEQCEDVLQNIEFGIVQVYRDHPHMTDWQALNAIEALLRAYQAEAKGIQPPPRPQDPLAQEVYGSVAAMCEWRLGRGTLWDKEGKPMETGPQPITLDEMVACLKRIRKSINRWTQRGGRQGYLSFVSQFIV